MGTVLVARAPLTNQDIGALDAICDQRGFTRLWPVAAKESVLSDVLQGGSRYTSMGIDLSPPTDDRPFFFQLIPMFGKIDSALNRKLSVNEGAVILLRWLVGFVSTVALIVLLLPFGLARRIPRGPEFWKGSGYFAAIGLAFILIETGLIQRFILYLGHPSHATTVVLTGMLLGAGLGSYAVTRAPAGRVRKWGWILPLLLGLITLVLPRLFGATLGWPFAARISASLCLLLPVTFLMGCAFPVGITLFGDEAKAWFWAMNGVSGVLAGVASLALAMTLGFQGVLWVGTAGYLAAWVLLRSTRSLSGRA